MNIFTKLCYCRSFTSGNFCILVEQFPMYLISGNISTNLSDCVFSTSTDQFRIYMISRNICTKFSFCRFFTSRNLRILVEKFRIYVLSGNISTKLSDCVYFISRNESQQLQSSTVLSFVLFVCTLQLVIITGYMHAALYILFAVQQSRNQTR